MTTTNAVATAVAVIVNEQTKTVEKFLSTMHETRPAVTFTKSERDGKVILQGNGDKLWPEIAIGKKGGVVIQVRTYDESKKSAFEWALEADGLLERQIARDAKKAGVKTEEVMPEKNIPAAPEKKPRVRRTKEEIKEVEQKATEQPDLMDELNAAIAQTSGK